jgi:hypothetical protein
VAAGATFLACGGKPAPESEVARISQAVNTSCTFTITKNEYDGPDYWGTIIFKNNGPSTATNPVVEFDVPDGVHCDDYQPPGATLSPLGSNTIAEGTTGSHCIFTFNNLTLAAGASKTFNYSADSTGFSAAGNVTVTSSACGGGGGGGGSATGLTCNTFSILQNSYNGPEWWGTIKFANNGPSTASSLVVEFDVPSGKHCTGEANAIPPGATLSPLTYPPNLAPQTASNHCVFTWTTTTPLLPGGDPKLLEYSADHQSSTAATNLTIRDGACAGPGAGGTGPDTRGSGSIVSTGTDVGALPGAVDVSSGGDPSYTIPLWTPAGRNGMTPGLALVYSGGGDRDGPAGLNWSVSGTSSMISRCATNSLRRSRPRPVKFEPTDTLCLDGRQLIHLEGSPAHGLFGAEYRTEPETFTKVVIVASSGGVPTQFKVQTRDGQVHFYGGDVGLRVFGNVETWTADPVNRDNIGLSHLDAPKDYGWLRGSVEDTFGNTIWFRYRHPDGRAIPGGEQEPLIDTIEYVNTGPACATDATSCSRLIKFNYSPRPENTIAVTHVAGMTFARTKLLSSIDMQVRSPGSQARRSVRFYRLTHKPSSGSGRMLLDKVEECDGNQAMVTGRVTICKQPTVFTYHDEAPGLIAAAPIPIANMHRTGDEDYHGIQPADMDGDGRDDLVYRAHRDNAAPGEPPHWFVRLSTGSGFTPPIDLNLTEGQNEQIGDAIIADFVDGDGLPDIAVPVPGATSAEKAFAFFRNGGVTASAASFTFLTKETTGPNQAMVVNDFHGKGTPSILRPTADNRWAYRFFRDLGNGPELTQASDPLNVNWPIDFADAGWSATSADIDGDGAAEFLVSTTSSNRLTILRQKEIPSGLPSAGNWEIATAASTLLKSTSADPVVHYHFDHNGDGLPDVLRLRRVPSNVQGEPNAPNVIMNSGAGLAFPTPAIFSNDGPPLSNNSAANVRLGPGTTAKDLIDPGVRILDLDGDGRDDIMLVDNGAIRDGTANPQTTPRANLTAP